LQKRGGEVKLPLSFLERRRISAGGLYAIMGDSHQRGGSMSNATTVADKAQVWALNREQVTWTNHQPASTLVQWYRNHRLNNAPVAPLVPIPAVAGVTMMVCYELPIYAAAHSGVLTPAALWNLVHAFDGVGRGSAASIMKALTSAWSFRKTFDQANAAEQMSRGDIVFFNGVGHVAIALGNKNAPNSIVSVWGMNPIGIQAGTQIEVTTIAAVLGQIAIGAPGLAQVVTYSSPSW
jgi:hypothetical protein